MQELNKCEGCWIIEDEGHDTLTVVDMGDTVSFSQTAEDGNLHNVILSQKMLREALELFLEDE
jgi:hypothetical protein